MILTSQQFNDAYGKLPFPIREFLASDEPGKITTEIGARYNLHIDTIGAVDREVSNMLLGLINPEQFVAELKAAGIAGESLGMITHELNEKIFVPLREKMRRLSEESHEQNADPDAEKAAANLGLVSATSPKIQPPTAPILAQVPTYTAPTATPQQTPMPRTGAIPQRTELPAPEQFLEIRTMANDIASVKAGEAPHATNLPSKNAAASVWEPAPNPVAAVSPAPIAPSAPSFTPPPMQTVPATPPAYQPPVAPPVQPVASPIPTQPSPTTSPSPSQNDNRDALHAVLKSYGIDPYREPPE